MPKKIREWFETHNIDKRGNFQHPDGNTYHIFKFEDAWYNTGKAKILACIFEVSLTIDKTNKIYQYKFNNKLDAQGRLCKDDLVDFRYKFDYDEVFSKLEDTMNDFRMIYDHYQYLSKTYKSAIKLKQLEADFSE